MRRKRLHRLLPGGGAYHIFMYVYIYILYIYYGIFLLENQGESLTTKNNAFFFFKKKKKEKTVYVLYVFIYNLIYFHIQFDPPPSPCGSGGPQAASRMSRTTNKTVYNSIHSTF